MVNRSPMFASLGLAICIALCGCQNVASSAENSGFRVISATTDAPALSFAVGTQTLFADLAVPSVSAYAPIGAGAATVTATPIKTGGTAESYMLKAVAGQQYSLLMTGSGGSYSGTVLEDQSVAVASGEIAIRLIDQAPVFGSADVYIVPDGTAIKKAKPVFSGVASGTVSLYTTLPAGTYDVIVTAAGATKALYTGTATTLTSGQARTFLMTDALYTNPASVTIAVGNDFG